MLKLTYFIWVSLNTATAPTTLSQWPYWLCCPWRWLW